MVGGIATRTTVEDNTILHIACSTSNLRAGSMRDAASGKIVVVRRLV